MTYNEKLRDRILGGMGWIYLWAFVSLYFQLPGIFFENFKFYRLSTLQAYTARPEFCPRKGHWIAVCS
jgi:hypothetical protein